MTAKISEILDLQHKEIMYALEQMKEAEKLIWKEAMAKAGFQINVLILLALALECHQVDIRLKTLLSFGLMIYSQVI